MKNSKFGLVCCSVFAGLFLSGCSDLIVTDVRYASFTGPMLQVKVKVKNEGFKAADASTTQVDIKPAGSTTFTRNLVMATSALASGQEIEIPFVPLYPNEVPTPGSGQCMELKACADSAGVVSESSEGNNCKINTICR